MNRSGIYQISFVESHKIYIGSAVNLRVRANNHIHHLRKGTHHNKHLQNAFNKYGESCYRFEVLITCDRSMCIWYEQQFLDQWKPEYNKDLIAGSRLGSKMSDKSREKMRQSALGRKHSPETVEKIKYNSKNISDETRKKLSDAHKGRIVSQETKDKISRANRGKSGMKGKDNPMYGKHLSDEIKQKISDSRKGIKPSQETIQKRSISIKESWRKRKEGVL